MSKKLASLLYLINACLLVVLIVACGDNDSYESPRQPTDIELEEPDFPTLSEWRDIRKPKDYEGGKLIAVRALTKQEEQWFDQLGACLIEAGLKESRVWAVPLPEIALFETSLNCGGTIAAGCNSSDQIGVSKKYYDECLNKHEYKHWYLMWLGVEPRHHDSKWFQKICLCD